MQALPAHAGDNDYDSSSVDIRYVNITGNKVTYESVFSSKTPQGAKQIDFTRNIEGITSIYTYSTSYTHVPSFAYFPTDTTVPGSFYGTRNDLTFKGGTIYLTLNGKYAILGDAKSILGGSSSSGLSEEQKTMIKDLIANWPGLCRLVEKFFKRNDDNNEYDKKT